MREELRKKGREGGRGVDEGRKTNGKEGRLIAA